LQRRGLHIEALTGFVLGDGPSKSNNLHHWSKVIFFFNQLKCKLWALNRNYVTPKAIRYTAISAISKDKICTLILNGDKYSSILQVYQVLLDPKRPELGMRPQFRTKELYLEYEDAKLLQKERKLH